MPRVWVDWTKFKYLCSIHNNFYDKNLNSSLFISNQALKNTLLKTKLLDNESYIDVYMVK